MITLSGSCSAVGADKLEQHDLGYMGAMVQNTDTLSLSTHDDLLTRQHLPTLDRRPLYRICVRISSGEQPAGHTRSLCLNSARPISTTSPDNTRHTSSVSDMPPRESQAQNFKTTVHLSAPVLTPRTGASHCRTGAGFRHTTSLHHSPVRHRHTYDASVT